MFFESNVTAMTTEFLIKGMVCNRCITVLHKSLEEKGLAVKEVTLGRVVLAGELGGQELQHVEDLLTNLGFDLLIDRQAALVSQVRKIIHETVDNVVQGKETKFRLSKVLADQLHLNYSSLSEIFVKVEGCTIEQYVIQRRLCRVKELLEHTDNTFTEIAYQTGFSSVYHFSKQFKDLTGFSPSQYRAEKRAKPHLKYPLEKRSASMKVKELRAA
jgi:AraC-like DNA-binding protein